MGDVKKLIPAGWKFQKLYANNYKSYHKDNIFMFVVSSMAIEITNVRSEHWTTLVGFILDHKDEPESFWQSYSSSFFKDTPFANWVLQNGKVITDHNAITNKFKWMDDWRKDETIEYRMRERMSGPG